MDAVPAPLFVTTAKPSRGITATPAGDVPTATELFTGVAAPGVRSMMETSLQPLFATTAILRCSSMATAPGCGVDVPLHPPLTSITCTTVKSAALDLPCSGTKLVKTTSKAKWRGEER